jgi:hypothetical protein
MINKGGKMYNQKKLFLPLLVISLFVLFLLTNCSDSSFTEPEKSSPPEFQMQAISLPNNMANSSDPNVQRVMSYITMANVYSQYSNLLVPPGGVENQGNNDGPLWVYSWDVDNDEYGVFTATLTIEEDREGNLYLFELIVDSLLDGQELEQFSFIKGQQSMDGTEGELKINDPNPENEILALVTWNSTEEGIYTLTIVEYNSYEIHINLDENDAGSLEVYQFEDNGDKNLIFKAVWNSDGTGDWYSYDENENEEDNGSW